MSSLVPPQEEKRDFTRSARVPVDHEPAVVTPPVEKADTAALVPPQEEVRSFPNSSFDKSVDHLDKELSKPSLHVRDEDPALSKVTSAAVRSGNAGVTGEDIGVAEHQHFV